MWKFAQFDCKHYHNVSASLYFLWFSSTVSGVNTSFYDPGYQKYSSSTTIYFSRFQDSLNYKFLFSDSLNLQLTIDIIRSEDLYG